MVECATALDTTPKNIAKSFDDFSTNFHTTPTGHYVEFPDWIAVGISASNPK